MSALDDIARVLAQHSARAWPIPSVFADTSQGCRCGWLAWDPTATSQSGKFVDLHRAHVAEALAPLIEQGPQTEDDTTTERKNR